MSKFLLPHKSTTSRLCRSAQKFLGGAAQSSQQSRRLTFSRAGAKQPSTARSNRLHDPRQPRRPAGPGARAAAARRTGAPRHLGRRRRRRRASRAVRLNRVVPAVAAALHPPAGRRPLADVGAGCDAAVAPPLLGRCTGPVIVHSSRAPAERASSFSCFYCLFFSS